MNAGHQERLCVAVVGVGWAGTRHVHAIRELGRKVQVTALVDNDADHLFAKAAELDVPKAYVDYEQALADPDIDAVSICCPHALHCPQALRAASAGKHVLVEKPMAMTVDEATQMIRAAEANQVKLYVAENVSYTTMSSTLRHIVGTGRYIGELTFASMTKGFRAPDYGYSGRRRWLSTPELGGTGTWMLHGIHSIAQLRYVLGEVETVYFCEHKASSFTRPDLEGTLTGLLTMASGIQVSVVQSCETRLAGTLRGFRVYGDKGSVRAGEDCYEVFSQELGEEDQGKRIEYPKEIPSSYAREMEAFADYVSGVAVGPTTAESERRTLAIVQAGWESAQSGQAIGLRERFGEL